MLPLTASSHPWPAAGGVTLPYLVWELANPAASPRAVVIAVHGLSGAALDFEPLGRYLRERGIVTLAPELRGQGTDPNAARRGDLDQLATWFRDLECFLSLARKCYPGLPLVFLGESMGAAILVRFLVQARTEDQPSALVLQSPVVMLKEKPPFWQTLLLRFVLAVRPRQRLNVWKLVATRKGEPRAIMTRDAAHLAWFETAPHRLQSFTVRFLKNLFELVAGCEAAAPLLQVPVLILYAGKDIFISPGLTEAFFARLGSEQKEKLFFPESYHLLLHDEDSPAVLRGLAAWLERTIA